MDVEEREAARPEQVLVQDPDVLAILYILPQFVARVYPDLDDFGARAAADFKSQRGP
jgi:hypothetical protein